MQYFLWPQKLQRLKGLGRAEHRQGSFTGSIRAICKVINVSSRREQQEPSRDTKKRPSTDENLEP